MNKADLIEVLAPRLGGRAQAATAVEALVDVVLREVAAGGSVTITGFGVFERIDRAARTGRNPRTGEAVPIAATSTPRFRPATYFKDVVSDPSGLPTDGLAGVRVGTHEVSERAGAPATVRRTADDQGDQGDRGEQGGSDGAPESSEGSATTASTTGTASPASAKVSSGKPDTVRKVTPKEPEPAAEQETSDAPARGGRLVIGGEDITRSMISAKKAQLARVKNDALAEKKRKAKAADSKKSKKGDAKDSRSGKKSKKADAKDAKSGKKSKKAKK